MKYKILILLILVTSLLCSCGRKHTHDFSGEYGSDETHHWQECECKEKGEAEEHKWNEGELTLSPTTETEGSITYTCSVCKYQRVEKLDKLDPDHEHTYSKKWSYDDTKHWHSANCEHTYEKKDVGNHEWDDGSIIKPPTQTGEDVITYTCLVCRCQRDVVMSEIMAQGLSFTADSLRKIDKELASIPLTVEADVFLPKTYGDRAGVIFGNYAGIAKNWSFEIQAGGVPRFFYTDTDGKDKSVLFNSVDIRTGDWAHVALSFDFANRTISLYLDGELAETVSCSANMIASIPEVSFVLGGDNRGGNTQYFKGAIRSLAAYSTVRSAEQIKSDYTNGVNSLDGELMLYYAVSGEHSDRDIVDLSGNGYTIVSEWYGDEGVELDYAYSFAVVGDTQVLCQKYPDKMEGIYDWIIANKDTKKIAHVFGLGDITEEWGNEKSEAEWIRAKQYISKLDGVIPYSLVRGNHDESHFFNKYFAYDAYMSQFDGFMVEGDIINAYKTFTVGATDYMLVTLDFGASDEMLDWANRIIAAHPDHRVIITTHCYLFRDGTTLNKGDIAAPHDGGDVDDSPFRSYNDGQQIWEKLVSRHPNIVLVLSGHDPWEDVVTLQSEGIHGNTVTQMLIDPQGMDAAKGGTGMICMLYFSADGRQMEVEWYSTDKELYFKTKNQFTVDLSGAANDSHDFHTSYDAKYHYMGCDCGYAYDMEAHSFDGGTLNEDGFMEYRCDCGYVRIASATEDPVAIDLQTLLESYFNGGRYYKEIFVGTAEKTAFYNADNTEESEYLLALNAFILGSHGELRLDLGWNLTEGVYSSVNESALQGARMFFTEIGSELTVAADRITVEEGSNCVIIRLLANDGTVAEAKIGSYATTYFASLDGDVLETVYTKVGTDGLCRVDVPVLDGLISEYDIYTVSAEHDGLSNTVYCSPVSVWDGSSVSSSLSGSGTEQDPYLIRSAADFAYLRTGDFSGRYFKMMSTVDLNGKAFTIGYFNGVLDGNHCSVRGINLTSTTENSGLFIILGVDSIISDLSLYGRVSGANCTGALAGVAHGKVTKVVNFATVSGAGNLGGIIGNSSETSNVSYCVNYGAVNGSSWNNGGIVGFAQNSLTYCVNYGTVRTTGDCAGGVVGTSHGFVSYCVNYGTVEAPGRAGGIAYNTNKVIEYCINYGTVNGTNPGSWDLGGILGYVARGEAAIVRSCTNLGRVKGATGIGGILGYAESTATLTLTDCGNEGEIIATWGGGGIAGNISSGTTVSGCVNNGSIRGNGQIGGIVGRCFGVVTECTNNGTVDGTDDIIGGIVGHLHNKANLTVIETTNTQNGAVNGPNRQEIIGTVDS